MEVGGVPIKPNLCNVINERPFSSFVATYPKGVTSLMGGLFDLSQSCPYFIEELLAEQSSNSNEIH